MKKTITSCDICGMEYKPKNQRFQVFVPISDYHPQKKECTVFFDFVSLSRTGPEGEGCDVCPVCFDKAYVEAMRSVIKPMVNQDFFNPVQHYASCLMEALERRPEKYDQRHMLWLDSLSRIQERTDATL